MAEQYRYPFTAIVGQEEMKLALVLNVVNPWLRGVLVQGERGTAKSTAVRSLAELLPDIRVVSGCSFNCGPDNPDDFCPYCAEKNFGEEKPVFESRPMQVVNLPVNATEDRVVGSIDLEKAVLEGKQHFSPGLLAKVNRGILYIDEVNLLGDHIMDLLLDVAAMGTNIVEREGISFSHFSRFILVGTMNPEEGDIRPQLTDRFDLSVAIRGVHGVNEREMIVSRRLDFETDPASFCKEWLSAQKSLSQDIIQSRNNLSSVKIPGEIIRLAGQLAEELKVDGHRAEIAAVKAAQAIASMERRQEVVKGDLMRGARLAFPHRLRRMPFDDDIHTDKIINDAIERLVPGSGNSDEEIKFSKKKEHSSRFGG